MAPRKRRPRSLWQPPSGEPPRPRVEKKWYRAVTANQIAFKMIYPKETLFTRTIFPELEKLVKSRGASDFFNEKRSPEGAHYVRAVLHLFGKNNEGARVYLYALKDAYPRKG